MPLNDGNAVIYNLEGSVQEPKEEETFELNLLTKEVKKFSWQVKNWLQENQRLEVSFELENNSEPIESGVVINSGKVIDLTNSQIQQYNIQVSVLKSGKYTLKCYFKNKKLNEYLYYKLILNVSENQNAQEIQMESFVREKSVQFITIENPLQKQVFLERNELQIN